MRLYHFLPANWALDDIKNRRLKISKIDDLNDPFELWCVSQQNQLRKPLREFKKEMVERYGMVCFSKHWRNPLLWSHYADKHRGVCLGFEVDGQRIKAVNYVLERPTLKFPPTEEESNELLYTKFRDWQYEEEWRGWFTLNDPDPSRGYYFFPFNDTVRLCEVIAGPLCNTPKAKIDEALKSYQDRVQVTKARLAFRSFEIVRNREAFRQ